MADFDHLAAIRRLEEYRNRFERRWKLQGSGSLTVYYPNDREREDAQQGIREINR